MRSSIDRRLAPAALCCLLALLMCLGALLVPGRASAQAGFDHLTTGFPLTGLHQDVRCETCHIKGIFKSTPRDCATCHMQGNPRSAVAKPVNHLPTSQSCDVCHSTATFGGARFDHAMALPGACATCHNGVAATGKTPDHVLTAESCGNCHTTRSFANSLVPANHIPFSNSAKCSSCHTSADFKVMPTMAAIHANAPSSTTNCAQCHGSGAASFANPATNFVVVGIPSNHLPTGASCETCHVGSGSSVATLPVVDGARFSGARMSHAGISNNCVACHAPAGSAVSFTGIGSIVGQPPTSPMGAGSHIPGGTACENCHLGALANVSGLIPATATRSAPGTLFATPAPTGAQIHSSITSGCNTCHEASSVWMGVNAYPISPSVKTASAQYTGFQTRPRAAAGIFNVADPTHPSTGDCSECHSNTTFFDGRVQPANHIPYATGTQCEACHTSTDFSVMPTLANIHANAPSTTTNCAQCHGAAAASFAIPAANFSIVGLPTNHIPTSAACESCHVGTGSSVPVLPVPNGAKFSGSRMSHAGITNNCVSCHVPSGTAANFAGITSIVGLPPTSPMGASSHIPSSTTCESCHAGTLANVSGLIPANATKTAPGTLFATPAPTTAQIHAGITGNCSSCHEAGFVWMGMASYPIAPKTVVANAQYTGFHTRPRAAAGTFSVADASHPATGDCSQCHSGTNFFSAQAKPANHIPTTANCTTCHIAGGDFSIAGLTKSMATLHTGITSGCIACHTAGAGAGPFAGCDTQAACTSPPPVGYQPKMMPLAPGGSPTAPSALTHVPAAGIACEKCHSATVFTSFAGMNMKGNSAAHVAVGAYTCITCHEGTPKYTWFGATNIVTRAVGHEGRKTGQDCIPCHNRSYNAFNAMLRPMIRAPRLTSNPGIAPRSTLLPQVAPGAASATATFDHQGVLPGQCASCHNGVAARGLSVKHLPTKASCDACHRSTAWLPAQFSHQGMVAGQCTSCHNTVKASGKSGTHFLTARSCDACHRTLSWIPVSYSHLSPAYRPSADMPTCTSCHVTNGEMIPRVMHGNPRVRPVPVPPGP